MKLWKPLFIILLMPERYIAIGGADAHKHGRIFRSDFACALGWVLLAFSFATLTLFAFGRLYPAAPVDCAKVAAAVGAALGGLATWFALATPEDTYDVAGRLDTKLRGFLFKVLFFPGLLLGVVGASW